MTDFKSQIARHRDTLNKLQRHIHATFELRDRSESQKLEWAEACNAFHGFESEVDSLLESVNVKTIAEDKQLREFVFDFISVDPLYFRSGYEKERLLKLLKSLEFTAHEKSVLCHTILHRVNNGALREFRRFCQPIPKIQNDDFVFGSRWTQGLTTRTSDDVQLLR